MNVLGKQIAERIRQVEEKYETSVKESKYRTNFHIMPPVGWLNDPNGLCQFQGIYHVFFQYSPYDVEGGLKVWGHYTSKDFVNFQYEGTPVLADQPFDCHGVYSGSTLVTRNGMEIFYTGNVKYDGDYDYITTGRGSNVVKIVSPDGKVFGTKKLLLTNDDYPADCTAHIRDPKVFMVEDGTYRMVLGARLKSDKGAVLLYRSKDLEHFTYDATYTTSDTLGYMWECPDIFPLGGKKVLSISPQGVTREKYRYQNVYHSGYFLEGSEVFVEWDYGFDFYAPQTFQDEGGRRILIGWAGLPDIDEEYHCKSVADNWQHCLTIPRELKLMNGKVYQYPIEEFYSLRGDKIELGQENIATLDGSSADIIIENIRKPSGNILIGSGCIFRFHQKEVSLTFFDDTGAGRTVRRAKVNGISQIRILLDVSILEIYINSGEVVMTSRIFQDAKDTKVKIDVEADICDVYQMKQANMGGALV